MHACDVCDACVVAALTALPHNHNGMALLTLPLTLTLLSFPECQWHVLTARTLMLGTIQCLHVLCSCIVVLMSATTAFPLCCCLTSCHLVRGCGVCPHGALSSSVMTSSVFWIARGDYIPSHIPAYVPVACRLLDVQRATPSEKHFTIKFGPRVRFQPV